MEPKPALAVASDIDRFGRTAAPQPRIDRFGGRFRAGVIYDVSLATVGEALGHYYWLDQTTIRQIAEFSAQAGNKGIKSRFSHPGMSSDGVGRHLGRIHNVRVEGEQAIGDLHFAKSAHDTPDGNLAQYVMQLVEEDPSAAGLSIVFHHDDDSELAFVAENTDDETNEFRSPDENNAENYPHVRIGELRAADVVDEPAANPEGMFDMVDLPRRADEFLCYATGLTTDKPAESAFGVDAGRAKQFLARWLDQHDLQLTKREAMSDDQAVETPEQPEATETETTETQPETVAEETTTQEPASERDEVKAELSRFTSKFGAELGVKWFNEGKSYADALESYCDELKSQLEAATQAKQEAEEKLASLQLGETEPVETPPADQAKKKTFAEYTRASSN